MRQKVTNPAQKLKSLFFDILLQISEEKWYDTQKQKAIHTLTVRAIECVCENDNFSITLPTRHGSLGLEVVSGHIGPMKAQIAQIVEGLLKSSM